MFRKFLLFFKYFSLISVLIHIFYSNSTVIITYNYFWVFTILFLMTNDLIRRNKLNINTNMYYLSLLIEMLITIIIRYIFMIDETIPLLIFPIIEILELKGVYFIFFIVLHALSYVILLTIHIGIPNNFVSLSAYITTILSYICLIFTSYSCVIIKREKENIKELNINLKLANKKLQQYLIEIKDLTASKERNLLAQELHDTLGHTLLSLNMHLEFARKIFENNPNRVKEVLLKCEEITMTSINNLKESVDLLKKDRKIKYFTTSIKEMINNFSILDNIKIDYISNENLDNLNDDIKTALYKTIKESITNSIKHGHSTKIIIQIIKYNNSLHLTVTNDGIKCAKIIKSNGLLGIEKRIFSLNGTVSYFSNVQFGFGIKVCIPILMEEL
ncbi:MAG: sensor histidine kinase [Clostridium sp.]|nr:sensor histidine kinase [Clostridium sp.]